MTKWRVISDLPNGINMKIDTNSIKGFEGYCDLSIIVTNDVVVCREMNIEYPYIYGAFTDTPIPRRAQRSTSKGVPEPFMPKEKKIE